MSTHSRGNGPIADNAGAVTGAWPERPDVGAAIGGIALAFRRVLVFVAPRINERVGLDVGLVAVGARLGQLGEAGRVTAGVQLERIGDLAEREDAGAGDLDVGLIDIAKVDHRAGAG